VKYQVMYFIYGKIWFRRKRCDCGLKSDWTEHGEDVSLTILY
jgi:hypothetical protein